VRKLLSPATIVPILIVAAVAAVVVVANIREGRRSRRPFTTATPLGASRAASTSREGLAGRVQEMDRRLAAHPDDVGAAVLLADALIRQSRIAGNGGLTARAETVLRRALGEDPANYEATRTLGTLYLSQHRFREAIEAGEKGRASRPSDPVNYGIIGDADLELGDYDAAFDAFDRMMALRPGAASYARVSYARELQGNLAGALAAMKLAADAGGGADLEAIAWYRAQAGELYLRLGQPRQAMQEFAAASQAFPGHPFAVQGYAKALEATGDRAGARTLLEDLVRTTPTPDLHAHLGDLLASMGDRAAAERHDALAEAAWRSDAPEPRNLARFLADRGRKVEEAVRLAETAAATRHDIFTEDALAWAYFKAGRDDDAKQAIARALRTGSRDPAILAHRAAIDAARPRIARR
jgi:tetratricopeptide (TPR) repeat protein